MTTPCHTPIPPRRRTGSPGFLVPQVFDFDLDLHPHLQQQNQSYPVYMGAWQGVAMDSLKFHPGPPCQTILHHADGPPLKWPQGRFRGSLPAGGVPCGRLLHFGIPHVVWICLLTVFFFSSLQKKEEVLTIKTLAQKILDKNHKFNDAFFDLTYLTWSDPV
jgi:hypothetical protein